MSYNFRVVGYTVLVLVLLTGCASKIVWSGADSDAAFKRDNYECSRDSRTYAGGSGLVGAIALIGARSQANKIYRECMESKGYTRAN